MIQFGSVRQTRPLFLTSNAHTHYAYDSNSIITRACMWPFFSSYIASLTDHEVEAGSDSFEGIAPHAEGVDGEEDGHAGEQHRDDGEGQTGAPVRCGHGHSA